MTTAGHSGCVTVPPRAPSAIARSLHSLTHSLTHTHSLTRVLSSAVSVSARSAASRVGVDLSELNSLLDEAVRRPHAELRRLWRAASNSERLADASNDCIVERGVDVSPTVALLRCLLSGSKVAHCVAAVERIRSSFPDDKVVLFSQFTRMLDVLTVCLAAVGVPFERFDGSMRADRQQAALDRFDSAPPDECACLLISLHAGGVGLNLTRANRCIIGGRVVQSRHRAAGAR